MRKHPLNANDYKEKNANTNSNNNNGTIHCNTASCDLSSNNRNNNVVVDAISSSKANSHCTS